MTKEEMIEMAKRAGFERLGHTAEDWVCHLEDIEEFIKLVAEHEREKVTKERDMETEQDCVGWFGYDTGLRLWFETNKGDDGAIPLYKARSKT